MGKRACTRRLNGEEGQHDGREEEKEGGSKEGKGAVLVLVRLSPVREKYNQPQEGCVEEYGAWSRLPWPSGTLRVERDLRRSRTQE